MQRSYLNGDFGISRQRVEILPSQGHQEGLVISRFITDHDAAALSETKWRRGSGKAWSWLKTILHGRCFFILRDCGFAIVVQV
jgi:hypothetical protein